MLEILIYPLGCGNYLGRNTGIVVILKGYIIQLGGLQGEIIFDWSVRVFYSDMFL